MVGGEVLSRNAMSSIAKKGLDPSLTDAEHVIQWLDEQVELEHMSYQALHDKVSETSLLLISKAQKRKEMLKEKMREAQALKDKKPQITPVAKKSGKRRRGKRRATKFDTSPTLSLDDFTLTEAEMEALAGDIARSGKVDLYMKGKKTSDSEPVVQTQLLKKMQELLDLGETLDAVEQQLKVDDKVLLGVAWCREDERLLFEKYSQWHWNKGWANTHWWHSKRGSVYIGRGGAARSQMRDGNQIWARIRHQEHGFVEGG